MLSREGALREIFDKHGDDAIYITNTGYISRAVYSLYPKNKNIFYMQGSMGLSPAIALGIASNTEKNIVCISGDASLLMHLGITHNIRDYLKNKNNLHVYVLDNGCHESVGAYSCSMLEDTYPGVTKTYKISNDGKKPRVGISFTDNATDIQRLLLNEKSV